MASSPRTLPCLASGLGIMSAGNWRGTNRRRKALVAELAQENPDLSPEKLQEAGQAFFSALAVEQQDALAWAAAQKIGSPGNSWPSIGQKFQRETCSLFLKWAEDQRAQEIAQGSAPNSEKIDKLGALMFGEDWKP